MPTYEYECRSCRHRFEATQSMRDTPLDRCPQCGGEVRRLVSGGSGFIIKGSGPQGEPKAGGCSLESTGRTCCGREERCGKPPCGGEE